MAEISERAPTVDHDAISHRAEAYCTSKNYDKGPAQKVAYRAYVAGQVEAESRADDLLAALEAARDHLEYCGYGDRWERECAKAEGLSQKIDAAITKARGKQEYHG